MALFISHLLNPQRERLIKELPKILSENIIGKNNLPPQAAFKEGLVLLIDKPMDWTSFDVVNKLRFSVKHKLGIKKIKVGHAGTLDPMATGLLIVCVGKYTKTIESLTGMDKTYSTTLKLGASTPSYDAESEEDGTYPYEHITPELIEETLDSFRGEIEQLPPMFSAVKIKGQKLYTLARKGISVERKARKINIHTCKVTRFEPPALDLFIHCTKGTYIRTIGHDLGQALGSGAYLTALRRDSIGEYSVKDALSIQECVDWINSAKSLDEIV
ncbi:MAG: tRNA pseudouridine(55) synthase TruB [Saprospiraceae bacterium]|nr:tRNA pseudouridine(55) synthase TruB [Saprospiraceae bacterium]